MEAGSLAQIVRSLREKVGMSVRELERRAAALRPGTFACREGQSIVVASSAAHAPAADPAPDSAAARGLVAA